MNPNKICFILCVNNPLYEAECMRYLSELEVPEGFEKEQLSVWDAECMTAGYNEAMRFSDAKYKVYLHQDVFIINKNFIFDLLKIFENPEIGMVGMVGSPVLPPNAVMWSGKRVGKIYCCHNLSTSESELGEAKAPYQEVEAIDGLLMATQADVTWREDLFRGWDFYDISQSMEFRRHGYKIVVPATETPWCIHDDGVLNYKNYFRWQETFLKEYGN